MAKDVSPETSAELAPRAQTVLLFGAFLLALAAWIYLCFVARNGLVHGADTSGWFASQPAAGAAFGWRALTAFEASAWGGIALLAIPVVLTIVPFMAPRAWRGTMALVAAGGAAITAALLATSGTGWFYLPAVAALVCAYFLPLIISGERPALGRTNWNLVGALVITLPGILLVGAMATGTFAWQPVTLGIAIGCVSLATVFARGIRWVSLTIGLLGLAAMIAGVVDGGMLLLVFWVLGGFWVVVGLTAFVSTGHVKHAGR